MYEVDETEAAGVAVVDPSATEETDGGGGIGGMTVEEL